MHSLDYYAKNLLPAVWSPDQTLTMKFRAQLAECMKRFTDVDAFLIGDAVSHYWPDAADVDVLLISNEESLPQNRQQAKLASGYTLTTTQNKLMFWVVPDTVTPQVLSRHFGPLYGLVTDLWYGRVTLTTEELSRPDALQQYAEWRLYKAKFADDLFPVNWTVLLTVFSEMPQQEREIFIDNFRHRVAAVDRNVDRVLTHQPKEIWRSTETFERDVFETEVLPPQHNRLPRRVVLSILHKFRYQDILGMVLQINEKLQTRTAGITEHEAKGLVKRVDQILTMLLQRSGGSTDVVGNLVSFFSHVLDNNRFVISDMQKRRIALKLYHRFYTGRISQ